MNVIFACPECGTAAQVRLDGPGVWECAQCKHALHLEKADPALPACLICGNHELYKKKDFPHGLGMSILILGCFGWFLANLWYENGLAWSILLGSALVDSILYLLVGDAIVCYRCHAQYKGLKASLTHQPHELTIGERYRQERLRREQMKTGGH